MKFEQHQCPEKFEIKKLTADDWEKFRELRLKGLQTDPESFARSYEEEVAYDADYWTTRLANTDRTYYVAEDGDRFVATATSNKYAQDTYSIQAVYTLPEFRGKGLSETLITKLIDEAKQKGAKKITLAVNQKNTNALSLYKKLGFTIATEKVRETKDGKRDYFYMEKTL